MRKSRMKILLAVMALTLVLSMLPAAMAAPQMETKAGGNLNGEGPFFEIVGLTNGDQVMVKLYSGSTLLCTKEITATRNVMTCSFDTITGKSGSWKQTPAYWAAYASVVPTHAELYVNGQLADSKSVTFTKEQWKALPSVKTPHLQTGSSNLAVNSDGEAAVFFEVANLPTGAEKEVKVNLYSGSTLLVSKWRNFSASASGTTASFYTNSTSSSWKQSPEKWVAYDEIMPTHAELYIDGVLVNTKNCTFSVSDWVNFIDTFPMPVHSAPKTGDSSNLMLWASLMIMAVCGMVVISRKRLSADR